MSNAVASGIFTDILGYYKAFSPDAIRQVESEVALPGYFIRHYHRPNLEKELISPCVVTVHHDLQDDDASLAVEKFLDRYREATTVHCLNTLQQRFLADQGITNTVVIPHGYNKKYIFPKYSSVEEIDSKTGSSQKKRIGLISRRYPRKVKGEAYIYELAQHLDPTEFEFVLIGKGRTFDAAILERYGYETTAYENLPYKMVASVYRSLDFLLMASWFEGGPANIPEAVGSAVPVLCNPIGMAYDFVSNGVNGLHLTMDPVVDAENISDWALNEKKFLSLRKGALEMKHRGITWEEHAKRIFEIYKNVTHEIVGGFRHG
ncbi:glycosyltransferase [Cupriavidus sp. a3]|uniref:glycosyltransferase n=1 Tax=Cupriavidus sp. a3 TaxID=3242158 RepID=UPI003D9C4FDF